MPACSSHILKLQMKLYAREHLFLQPVLYRRLYSLTSKYLTQDTWTDRCLRKGPHHCQGALSHTGQPITNTRETKYISSSTLLWNSHFYLWVLLKNALSIQPTPVSKPEHPPEGQVSEHSQASGRESNLSDQVLRIARLENYKQAPEWINQNVID